MKDKEDKNKRKEKCQRKSLERNSGKSWQRGNWDRRERNWWY